MHLGAGQEEEPFLSREGEAIEFLGVKRDPDRSRWVRELKWIQTKQVIPMIYMG